MNWTCMECLQYMFAIHKTSWRCEILNMKCFPPHSLQLTYHFRPCNLFVYLQTLIVGHKPAAKSYFLAVNVAAVINIHNLYHQMPFANAHRERCPPREWIQPWIAISRLSLRCREKTWLRYRLSLICLSLFLVHTDTHTHIHLNSDIQDQYHPIESEIFHTLNAYLT